MVLLVVNQYKMKISRIRELYKRFVESEVFKEVYKDKSVGEQIKIEK